MGRFMGLMPDLDTLKPVLGTAAGYGGPWALPITCRWLALSRRDAGAGFPLIGTNGARTGHDVARCLLAGASAVEMTSAVFQGGFTALTAARDELGAWLEGKDLAAADIVGRAADAAQSYAEQPARPGHWRGFVPAETLEGQGET
jgi:dihydroorotate dehydrogenase (NAD+) catalytic subunit